MTLARNPAETALHENFTGRVADLIIDESKKWRAQLIVMGTHASGGFRHAVMGSDAETVLHGAEVPVLLCEGTIRIGWVDAATLRPARMPTQVKGTLERQGGSMSQPFKS